MSGSHVLVLLDGERLLEALGRSQPDRSWKWEESLKAGGPGPWGTEQSRAAP